MTDRKKKILKAIVNEYVMSAEPVGSRTLARRYDFGVSPATLRNDMADLEEANYLEQPHRSAGRIPTDKGYRFYVDALMDLKKLSNNQAKVIEDDYSVKNRELQDLIEETSQLLSDLTNYTSMVLSPQIRESIFQHLQLVPISSKKVLIVLVTDTGLVKNRIIDVIKPIDSDQLANISRFLNERLYGLPLQNISDQLLLKLTKEFINKNTLEIKDLSFINNEIFTNNNSKRGKIYFGGTAYILDQPEFNDINKVKTVLNVLEHDNLIYDIFNKTGDKSNHNSQSGVEVIIGSENYFEEIKDCSFVIATYNIKGRPIGKIGVLGPTRMEYAKVVESVRFISEILSNLLTNK
ncbi:heat-inducible transcriptional repressor HrcA [Halonatronum saccharophilum]|uniref:heat-inducible transcriptional repressor HrcA n=1 Tax=Halonatronum saccharophilum TaxID=150060 RepID=UPI0005597F06|nr:heat-inducible transcriptional repressor HrcA [Halonatronum saccharophilum]